MMLRSISWIASCFLPVILVPGISALAQQGTDPLPSWNETSPKKDIIDFVARVTNEGKRKAGTISFQTRRSKCTERVW